MSIYSLSPKDLKNRLRYVIKEHHATRVHFDLRFEVDGVLKSFVIDETGPSMKPNSVRKVVMVADHDPEHIYREGIIPPGYGAGPTIAWDGGAYFPKGGGISKSEDTRILSQMFKKGDVSFFILARKLRGEFRLIREDFSKNTWLLIKITDIYCTDEDMLKLNKSVISGITIDDLKYPWKKTDDSNLSLF